RSTIQLPGHLNFLLGHAHFGPTATINYDGKEEITIKGMGEWHNSIDGKRIPVNASKILSCKSHIITLSDCDALPDTLDGTLPYEKQQTQAVLVLEYK
ncbi:MAG: hypothetical protein AABW92_05775, partial [Nanoarchaeota archaeon]